MQQIIILLLWSVQLHAFTIMTNDKHVRGSSLDISDLHETLYLMIYHTSQEKMRLTNTNIDIAYQATHVSQWHRSSNAISKFTQVHK